jgi:Arc/MetJ family transcription regulator
MATNLAIDESLLEEALLLGGLNTKKATVNQALREFIKRRQRGKSLDFFGAIDFDESFDHKKARKKR